MAGFIQFQQSSMSGAGSLLIVPGIMLFSFGFLILIMPELLAILVASFFMMTGFSFMLMGFKAKKPKKSNTITVESQSQFFE